MNSKNHLGTIDAILLTAVLTALVAVGYPSQVHLERERSLSHQIGSINDEAITRRDFQNELGFRAAIQKARGREADLINQVEVLNRLVADTLTLQQAQKSGLQISKDNVQAEIMRILQSLGTNRPEFQGFLFQSGLSWQDFEHSVEDFLLINLFIREGVLSGVPGGEQQEYLQIWLREQYQASELDFDPEFLDEINSSGEAGYEDA